jgi:hypothetical protein
VELWQTDITLVVHLASGSGLSMVTGTDDHFRFSVMRQGRRPGHGSAGVRGVARSDRSPRPVEAILSDNGKVLAIK